MFNMSRIYRNKGHAFAAVTGRFLWVILRLEVVPKMLASK